MVPDSPPPLARDLDVFDAKSMGYEKGKSYIVSCSSEFREAVLALAEHRGVSPADLARAVLLLLPADTVAQITDPGGPPPGDREAVILQSGPSRGRTLRRKPRLQLRLPKGHTEAELRRALALALEMGAGERSLSMETKEDRSRRRQDDARVRDITEENQQLRRIVEDVSFVPIRDGVASRNEALHVLGFAPNSIPDFSQVRQRFRKLAMVYHPDSPFGDHQRMSQLNQALETLTRS